MRLGTKSQDNLTQILRFQWLGKIFYLTLGTGCSTVRVFALSRRNYLDQIIRKSLHHTTDSDDEEEHDIATRTIKLKDVLLLKPEHLKIIAIASTGLLLSIVIIVGLGDWYFQIWKDTLVHMSRETKIDEKIFTYRQFQVKGFVSQNRQ